MKTLQVVAVGAFTLAVGLLIPASAASPSGSAGSVGPLPPLIMSGIATDTQGDPLANATIIASIEHYEASNDRVKATVIGRTISDEAGNFALNGSLLGPSSENPDGSVVMLVTTVTNAAVWHRVVNLVPPDNGSSNWRWPSSEAIDPALAPRSDASADLEGTPAVDVLLAAGAPSVAMNTSTEMVAPFTPEETDLTDDEKRDLQIDAAAKLTGTTAAMDAAYAAAYAACGEFSYTAWENTGVEKSRMVPIGWDAVQNRMRMQFSWSTSKKTTMSVAFAGTGTNYAGGLTYSKTRSDSTGVGWNRNDTNTIHHYRLDWRYMKQKELCVNSAGHSVETGKVRYYPWYTTLGNSFNNSTGSERFTCDPDWRVKNSGKIWVSRDTTEQWTGWFKIAGVPMKSLQQTVGEAGFTYESGNGQNVQRWFELRNSFTEGRICGKGGFPTNVPFVEEVPVP